jgi:hypothetical protein
VMFPRGLRRIVVRLKKGKTGMFKGTVQRDGSGRN